MAKSQKKTNEVKEPSIIVRPVARMGGLDNIHVALLVLVAILIAIVVVVSYSRPVLVKTISNCTYGALNGTCYTPAQNVSSIKGIVEKTLASYAYVNSPTYVLAYMSNVSAINASFIPTSGEWLASFPFNEPEANGSTAKVVLSMLISDKTGKLVGVSSNIGIPSSPTNNTVVSEGVIKIAKQISCAEPTPLHVQWFMDPYAPSAIQSLSNVTNIQSTYGSKVNLTINIIQSQYTQQYADTYGTGNALALGAYVFCASRQGNFTRFSNNLQTAYDGQYMPPSELASIASSSGLNSSSLNMCVNGADHQISAQTLLGQFYGVDITPSVVTDCEYMSLPTTERGAICYSNSTLC